jgi:hypothetical protein
MDIENSGPLYPECVGKSKERRVGPKLAVLRV